MKFLKSHNSGFILLSYFCLAVSFGNSFLLAAILPPVDLGYYTSGLVIGGMLSTLILFGTDKTLVRDIVQDDRPTTVLVDSIATRATFGILPLLATISFVSLSGNAICTKVALSLVGLLGAFTPRPWFDAQNLMVTHSLIASAERATIFGCILLLGSQGITRPFPYAITYLGVSLLSLILQYWVVLKNSSEVARPRVDPALIKNGIPVATASVGNLGLTHVTQLIIEKFSGAIELAAYGLAFQVAAAIQFFQSLLTRLLAPQISKNSMSSSPKEMKQLLLHHVTRLAMVSLATSVLALFAFSYLLPFYDAKLAAALPICGILCAWTTVFGPAVVVSQYMMVTRLEKSYLAITLSIGILGILVSLILVPNLGGIGAALTLFVCHSISVALQFVLVWGRISVLEIAR